MSALKVLCVESEGAADFADKIACAASEYFSLSGGAEVELSFVSAEEIRMINKTERGADNATDVLIFPLLNLKYGEYKPFTKKNYPLDINPESGNVLLGSIVICNEVAAMQAEEYGHGVERERGFLFLHGLLHVLGFDHIDDGDRAVMRKAEEEILAVVGLRRGEEKC